MDNIMINESRTTRRNTLIRIISFSWVKKSTLVEIISLWFVILFLYTGISKLMDYDVFQEQLEDSPILGPVAQIIAIGLPALEFVVCVLLFFPRYRIKGLYAAFILMLLFTSYVSVLIATSKELPCSCGGIIGALSWQGHLIFNSTMLLLSFFALLTQRKLNSIKPVAKEERFLTSHV